jgi:predicted transposase YdaD
MLVIYPSRGVERSVPQMESIVQFCHLHRVYLDELPQGSSLAQDTLRLMASTGDGARELALQLIQTFEEIYPQSSNREEYVTLIVEGISRINPALSKQEIRRMLDLVPFEQTRFYKDVKKEGEQSIILQQLEYRVGRITPATKTQVEALASEQLALLGKALFDFSTLEDLQRWLNDVP